MKHGWRIFSQEVRYRGRVKLALLQPDGKERDRSGTGAISEFEFMRAPETLRQTVLARDLVARWKVPDEAAAVARLAAMVEPSFDSSSGMIFLDVYSRSPEEAAELANAVADAYESRRGESAQKLAQDSLQAMEARLADQLKKVEEARRRMEELEQIRGTAAESK